ncbi:MAG: TorF family putative porin [Methylophilaceae bacterium]
MRKSLLMIAVLGAISASTSVFAEEALAPAAAAETPAYTLTYNIGLFSSYQFRGLTQTAGRPALQGGVDWTHSSGFYLGAWGSNISWLADAGAYKHTGLEIDVYGGYKNTIGSTGIGYDVGLLQYYYPGDVQPGFATANTLEGKAALTYSWFNTTAWYIFTKDGLGVEDARGSYYLEANANIPIMDTGITAILHVGRQEFDGTGDFAAGSADCRGNDNDCLSYTDYKIGASKAWDNGVTFGGYYTDTTSKRALYTDSSHEYLGKDKVTFFVQKTF